MKLLLLLLSLGLGLACAQGDSGEAPVQPDFQSEKALGPPVGPSLQVAPVLQVEGPWHTLELGATDRSTIEEGGAYRCFLTSIRNLANRNLHVTYFQKNNDGKCVEDFFIGEETDTPGRYTFEYKGKNVLTFVAVGEDYVIMDYENIDLGLVVVELLARPPSLSPPGREAFRKYLSRRGIGPDAVEDLTVQARCP
ncbi:beta-lactoglobulin [Cavia porcellus]|uniref:beta-lactoglobulin n=1 Tax=Cavia porcellus TaxID=10141 RepID=UPI002FE14105